MKAKRAVGCCEIEVQHGVQSLEMRKKLLVLGIVVEEAHEEEYGGEDLVLELADHWQEHLRGLHGRAAVLAALRVLRGEAAAPSHHFEAKRRHRTTPAATG